MYWDDGVSLLTTPLFSPQYFGCYYRNGLASNPIYHYIPLLQKRTTEFRWFKTICYIHDCMQCNKIVNT